MNLQDLMTKLKSIDENLVVEPTGDDAAPVAPTKDAEPATAECGMPVAIGGSPKQQDNVTMNVSMNGSGAGGISDLMKILRNIEQSDNLDPHHHDVSKMFAQPGHAEPLMGQEEEEMAETIDDDKEDWGNSVSGASGHHTHGVDAVTFSGDDMNSKGKSSPLQRAPGTNTLREPTNVSEALVSRLSEMYAAIKEDPLNPETDAQRRKREFDEKIRKNDQKFVKNVKRRANVPQHEKDTAARIEKQLKGEKTESVQMNESKEINDIITLTKMLKG